MACLSTIPLIDAVALLNGCKADARLLALKNLCVNNGGLWTVPEDGTTFSPVLFEVSLWGVSAFADAVEELPKNWLKAAGNYLDHAQTQDVP